MADEVKNEEEEPVTQETTEETSTETKTDTDDKTTETETNTEEDGETSTETDTETTTDTEEKKEETPELYDFSKMNNADYIKYKNNGGDGIIHPDVIFGKLDQKDKPAEDTTDKSTETKETKKETKPKGKPDEQAEGDSESGDKKTKTKTTEKKEEKGKTAEFVPFTVKANGKDIEIKTQEEMTSLVQKGISFTKKSMALAPDRKLINALKDAGLNDEKTISELVAIKKNKDPKALAKWIKEAGIDPIDINADDGDDFKADNIFASDADTALREAGERLAETKEGQELAQHMATWDKASLAELGKKAEQLVPILEADKASGVYDTITDHLDRLVLFGRLTVPYLAAYAELSDKAKGIAPDGSKISTETQGEPSKTKKTTPSPKDASDKLSNGDKAESASPTRKTPTQNTKPADLDFTKMDNDTFKKWKQQNGLR